MLQSVSYATVRRSFILYLFFYPRTYHWLSIRQLYVTTSGSTYSISSIPCHPPFGPQSVVAWLSRGRLILWLTPEVSLLCAALTGCLSPLGLTFFSIPWSAQQALYQWRHLLGSGAPPFLSGATGIPDSDCESFVTSVFCPVIWVPDYIGCLLAGF